MIVAASGKSHSRILLAHIGGLFVRNAGLLRSGYPFGNTVRHVGHGFSIGIYLAAKRKAAWRPRRHFESPAKTGRSRCRYFERRRPRNSMTGEMSESTSRHLAGEYVRQLKYEGPFAGFHFFDEAFDRCRTEVKIRAFSLVSEMRSN